MAPAAGPPGNEESERGDGQNAHACMREVGGAGKDCAPVFTINSVKRQGSWLC